MTPPKMVFSCGTMPKSSCPEATESKTPGQVESGNLYNAITKKLSEVRTSNGLDLLVAYRHAFKISCSRLVQTMTQMLHLDVFFAPTS